MSQTSVSTLNCKICGTIFTSPTILPCLFTVCETHLANFYSEDRTTIECPFCDEKHLIPDQGFPRNIFAESLLKLHKVSPKHQKAIDSMKHLKSRITECSNFISDQEETFIRDYVQQIRLTIEEQADADINTINKQRLQRLEQLAQFEQESILKAKEVKEDLFNNFSERVVQEQQLNEWSIRLDQIQLDDQISDDLNTKLDKTLFDLESALLDAKGAILDKRYRLKPSDLSSCSPSTLLEYPSEFKIIKPLLAFLSLDLAYSLINLIGFLEIKDLSLLYQGTRDGFSIADFHSKCDESQKTLTIARSTNGNVFGGYTEEKWVSNCTDLDDSDTWHEKDEKYDPNAFIFSLINRDNKSIVFKAKEGVTNIWCGYYYMPSFGLDLIIANQANDEDLSSSANLGHCFQTDFPVDSEEAKTFLAGTKEFFLTDIAVFEII